MNLAYEERSDVSRHLEEFWRSLRADQEIPRVPADWLTRIPDILPHVMLVNIESVPQRSMTATFAGTGIQGMFGFDPTGQNMADTFGSTSEDDIWVYTHAMQTQPCGLVQRNETRFQSVQSSMLETTVFPVVAPDGSGGRMISTLVNLGVTLSEKSQTPISFERSRKWAWIDLGQGVPPLD